MTGRRRRSNTLPVNLEPGDYVRRRGGWWCRLPSGVGPVFLTSGIWTVEEHADRTITVSPSIHDTRPGGWHGWLRAGEWSTA